MQINRLLEIIFVLLGKEHVTAKMLADRFGVSTRTIYRDIDVLSTSGVPVYSSKGKGGGIFLLPEFVLNKSLLSKDEQNEILFGLHVLKAAKYPEVDSVLRKVDSIFKNHADVDWIEVDFSRWNSDKSEQAKFGDIKSAILNHKVITFDYISAIGEKTSRTVEPIKLVFKQTSWYLLGFCMQKRAMRTFRISRINNLTVTEKVFNILNEGYKNYQVDNTKNEIPHIITLKLKFSSAISYRIYDDFEPEEIKQIPEEDGFEVNVSYPAGQWVLGYILSYGDLVEVLEPDYFRDLVLEQAAAMAQKYQK